MGMGKDNKHYEDIISQYKDIIKKKDEYIEMLITPRIFPVQSIKIDPWKISRKTKKAIMDEFEFDDDDYVMVTDKLLILFVILIIGISYFIIKIQWQ